MNICHVCKHKISQQKFNESNSTLYKNGSTSLLSGVCIRNVNFKDQFNSPY